MKAKYIFLNIYVSQKKRTFEKKKKKLEYKCYSSQLFT